MRKRPAFKPVWWAGIALATLLSGCGALLTPHYRVQRAEREMRAGQWRAAAFDLRAALRKAPNDAQAWVVLARVSLAVGDPSGAQLALDRAISAGARNSEVDALKARTWLAAGQYQSLIGAIDRHSIKLPEPQGTMLEARAWLMGGHPKRALKLLMPLVAREPSPVAPRILVAAAQMQLGKFAQAQSDIETAIRTNPADAEPRLVAGQIDAAQGQFAKAERSLLAALQRMSPGEPMTHRVAALTLLAESRLALSQMTPAAATVATLAKLEPRAPMTLLLQARLKLARGDFEVGSVELERVVQLAPQFVQARLLLAAAFVQRGDLEQAQEQLQQIVSSAPDNMEARRLLAQVQLKLGAPGRAISVLVPALSAPRLDSQVLRLLGIAAERIGNSHQLQVALQSAANQHPNNPGVWLNLAQVEIAAGHPEQALMAIGKTHDNGDLRRDQVLIDATLAARGQSAADAAVEHLLVDRPHDAGVLDLCAGYFAAQRRFARARALLHEALAMNSEDSAALVELARIDEVTGNAAAAERRLHVALRVRPDMLALRVALAMALASRHSFAEARTVLETAPHASKQTAVQFALARLALLQGNLSRANAALDRVIALQPDSAERVEQAGLMLLNANQNEAALARLVQAATLEPGDPVYWLNTARAQLAVNQPIAARAALEKAERLRPNWLPAVNLLVLIDVRQGKLQAALSCIDALLIEDPSDPRALMLKGDVELANAQPVAAVDAYAAAQRIQPSAVGAVKLFQAKRAARARDPAEPLEAWLKRWPADWRIRTVLGNYYLLEAHETKRGMAELSTAIAENPADAVALNNLAWAMSRNGDPCAEAIAQRAYRLVPQSAQINDTLGWILVRKGKRASSLGYLKRATQFDPGAPQLQYHYAYALAQNGQRVRARKILERILSQPRPFDSRAAAARLLAALKV